MAYKVLHNSKIDSDKWNLCVHKYQMDIYNEYNFLNAVCLSDWYGFVWGDYEKVLPFYRKKKWGIVPYVCMPPFCQKFDNRSLTNEEWVSAMIFLKDNNLKIDFAVVDGKMAGECIERFNFVLDKKNLDIEKTRNQYSSLLRKNIEKASMFLELRSKVEVEDIQKLINKLPIFQNLVLKKYSKQFEKLKSDQLSGIYALNREENELLAMLLYAKFDEKYYLLFPYASEEGRKKQAMSLLIASLIESDGVKLIDFEGSSIDSIANFYAQFGAEKQSYWSFHWKSRFLSI